MKLHLFRRALCILCALALFVSALPAAAAAGETEGMTYTDALVGIVKSYEGFTREPYNDGTGWYIGYGSSCDRADYPDGITEAEADALLRTQLNLSRDVLNRFMKRNGIRFTQNEFDGLCSLVYNIGYRWLSQDTRLTQAIKEGQENYTDLEIINFFGSFCHFMGSVSRGLARRRIEEACVFRFGDYEGRQKQKYTYLIYDADGGEMDSDVCYYIKGRPYEVFNDAWKDGFVLTGWKADSGLLKASDTADGILKVTAVWTPGVSEKPHEPTEPAQPAKPSLPSLPPMDFTDVAQGQWFYDSVRELSSTGTVNGYPDGSFRPQESVSVGAALKMILIAAGFGEQAPDGDHWASGYARLAVMEGMISAADAADLDAPASRLLTAQAAAQAAGIEYSYGPSPFPDTEDGFVVSLYEEEIVKGSPDGGRLLYKPNDSLTRAELCTIVLRMIKR